MNRYFIVSYQIQTNLKPINSLLNVVTLNGKFINLKELENEADKAAATLGLVRQGELFIMNIQEISENDFNDWVKNK